LGLNVFNADIKIASKREVQYCKPKIKFVKRWWQLTGRDPDNKLFKETKEFCFDPNFFDCPDGSYIRGFWQTEKYFQSISEIIRQEFAFRFSPDEKNYELLNIIKNTNAVSIHIRRGDYVSVVKTNQLHGLCDLSYYINSVNIISNKYPNVHFFIFSDDIPWARANLVLDSPCTYVDINSENNSHEDLRLMTYCKHNIIANSSFSWWGAWLNKNPKKIVIAPKKWMTNVSVESIELIPDTWIKI
jgi:hypothetical protein